MRWRNAEPQGCSRCKPARIILTAHRGWRLKARIQSVETSLEAATDMELFMTEAWSSQHTERERERDEPTQKSPSGCISERNRSRRHRDSIKCRRSRRSEGEVRHFNQSVTDSIYSQAGEQIRGPLGQLGQLAPQAAGRQALHSSYSTARGIRCCC